MSKVVLFIAASLDGFIARENGSIDWLLEFPNPENLDYGYNDLISDVDLIVMGRKTYEDILSFDIEWPYRDLKTFVVSKNINLDIRTENSFLLNSIDKSKIDELKSKAQKNIWLVGGSEINSIFLQADSIRGL